MSTKTLNNCNSNVCNLLESDCVNNEENEISNQHLYNLENITDLYEIRKIILDFTNELDYRIYALKYFNKIFTDFSQTLDIIQTISSMYQLSGTKILETYLYEICTNDQLLDLIPFIKFEAVKGLLGFEELIFEGIDEDELELINQRNIKRKNNGYIALDILCNNSQFIELPTPCKYEAIIMLMFSGQYLENCSKYFSTFINNIDIDSDYRYKCIISLENKKDYENNFIPNKDYYIEYGMYIFLNNNSNLINYRILSGQYLLQKSNNTEYKNLSESKLLEFAKSTDNDYNRRADSADVLLRLGSEKYKEESRKIIVELGKNGNKNTKTIFDNAQNVHNIEVENSVMEILEYLSNIFLMKINKCDTEYITFEYVKNEITKLNREINNIISINCDKSDKSDKTGKIITCKHKNCKNCNSCIKRTIENYYCSRECVNMYKKVEKINTALNRIYLDRALYSKYNLSLSGILLKVWSYIFEGDHNNSEEMIKRLLEELEEMSDTCSSGFASRLVNVISGFGEFNIKISWEDQIISNFTGRLNALARKITNTDSVYYKQLKDEVIKLWERNNNEVYDSEKVFITDCVQDFAANVISELTVESSNYEDRKNFLLFLRTSIPVIKEEMYKEFKEYISDVDFDFYMRKSVMMYEMGEIY